MSVSEIIEGMARVEAANAEQRYTTVEGRFPCCKNAVGTWFCERCGADVRQMNGKPCPSIPPESRWDVRYPG